AKTLKRRRPYDADIAVLTAAWGVEEPELKTFLRGMALKPGALGNITETMELASINAAGEGVDVILRHVQAAWKNRPTEDLA
ncbi:MAG: DNA transposition protein, partial [Pseudomonadota bacterium]